MSILYSLYCIIYRKKQLITKKQTKKTQYLTCWVEVHLLKAVLRRAKRLFNPAIKAKACLLSQSTAHHRPQSCSNVYGDMFFVLYMMGYLLHVPREAY